MIDLLTVVAERMRENNISYAFEEWKEEVRYPYFVGSFVETAYRHEDGCTVGSLTIDGWGKHSASELLEESDKIKRIFDDLRAVDDSAAFYIRFNSSQNIPTGEEGLYRVQINLDTNEWKGE